VVVDVDVVVVVVVDVDVVGSRALSRVFEDVHDHDDVHVGRGPTERR
jgi:hypothetical protein